jgi:hypothetical protein
MPERLIELDMETPAEPTPRRRGVLLVSVLGAIVIAAVTLTVSHWQRMPPRPHLGGVVRASGMDVCSDEQFVGLTFFVVNDDPKPVTLTSADFVAAPGITDAAADLEPEGTLVACRLGGAWPRHQQVVLQPGDLGLVVISYRTSCALQDASAPPISRVAVHLIEDGQTAVRVITPNPDDLKEAMDVRMVNCDLPPNPSVETAA